MSLGVYWGFYKIAALILIRTFFKYLKASYNITDWLKCLMKLGIKGHMSRLPKEGTCIIHHTEKAKTHVLKVIHEKCGNSFFVTIVCCKH